MTPKTIEYILKIRYKLFYEMQPVYVCSRIKVNFGRNN